MSKSSRFQVSGLKFAKRWRVVLPSLIAYCLLSTANSQDLHFSQFNFSPLNENPANTGLFTGDYRFIGNYKNQWPTVPVRYNTASLSADMNLFTLRNNDRVGGGILFFYDRAGDSRFTDLNADVSFSYIKMLDKASHHQLSLGAQTGIVSQSFDYSQLTLDNQWNGDVFDPNIAPANPFAKTRANDFDLGVGLAYRWVKTDRTNLTIGLGAMHINDPRQAFYDDNPARLSPRFTAPVRLQWQLTSSLDIVPELMFQEQQTKSEFDMGGHIKYYLATTSAHKVALNLGAYGRITDAGWLFAGMDYDNWQVNLSYDLNFSQLHVASNYDGGFEASVIYILTRVPKINKPGAVCPTFL